MGWTVISPELDNEVLVEGDMVELDYRVPANEYLRSAVEAAIDSSLEQNPFYELVSWTHPGGDVTVYRVMVRIKPYAVKLDGTYVTIEQLRAGNSQGVTMQLAGLSPFAMNAIIVTAIAAVWIAMGTYFLIGGRKYIQTTVEDTKKFIHESWPWLIVLAVAWLYLVKGKT